MTMISSSAARLQRLLHGLLVLSVFWVGSALAQTTTAPFDHLQTGFALTGEHTRVRCESCHLNGIFKGTPRDCASCHLSGKRFARANVVMPLQHPPTQQSCETCHTTTTFVGAKFSHAGVATGTCLTCHNGKTAGGKPETHIPTNASCDSCHRTAGWVPASKFDHAGVTPGSCVSCHNGTRAKGKSAQHMPVGASQSCDDCHKGFSAWRPTAWNHTQGVVVGQCASCHSGGYPPADGKPTNHIPYQTVAASASANCDSCHKGSYSTWANGKFHANVSVTSGCASCHTGGFLSAVGKPTNPIHSGVTGCESCHTSATAWAGAKVDHSSYTASTNCASCHDGRSAAGLSSTHVPVGAASCFACHYVSPQKFTPTKWNHTQMPVVAQCASCHSGGYPPADGKPTNHIPYQTVAVTASANCDGCHKGSYTTWANGKLHINFSISTGCRSCHTGTYLNATGKPTNHIPEVQLLNGASMECNACHTSVTAWTSMTMNHNGSQGNGAGWCKACHQSGTSYLGNMQKMQLNHRNRTPAPTDCSLSGCHRPLGNIGTLYRAWN